MVNRSLFKVHTRGCGNFYVVSATFDDAAKIVGDELNNQDYGYSSDRLITSVDFICRQELLDNGMRKLYGEHDDYHLILADDVSFVETERGYAKRLTELEEENAKLHEENAKLQARFDELTSLATRIKRNKDNS